MTVVHCEWGQNGVEAWRSRAVVVVVDVLSFSTAVDLAVARGASIMPFPPGDEDLVRAAAKRMGVETTSARRAAKGVFSLSPASVAAIEPGDRLLLPSQNGARLSQAGESGRMMTGCLRNARAVAAKARALAGESDIAVVPAGERWPDETLRPALEDLIGAGAVIDALDLPMTVEAESAREAFRSVRARLAQVIRATVSGQELLSRAFFQDLDLAVELDASQSAPVLRDGAYVDG